MRGVCQVSRAGSDWLMRRCPEADPHEQVMRHFLLRDRHTKRRAIAWNDEVIEQELILFVTLNVNKNTEPVPALGIGASKGIRIWCRVSPVGGKNHLDEKSPNRRSGL